MKIKEKPSRLFMNGRSQAVRIPKDFQFECEEVLIEKKGEQLILTPLTKSWTEFFDEHEPAPEDFMDHDRSAPAQTRELF